MSTLNYKFNIPSSEDKENVQMAFKKPVNKGKVFGEKVNVIKEQFVTCKATKFEEDPEDNKLLEKKREMPMKSVQNWTIHPLVVQLNEEENQQ